MKSNYFRAGFSSGMILLAACNARTLDPTDGELGGSAGQSGERGKGGNGGGGRGGESGSAPDELAGKAGQNEADSSGGAEPADQPHPSAATCESISARAAAEIAAEEACTVVVRVDSATLAVTGHALVCGPHNVVDEAGARASADGFPVHNGPDGTLGTGDLLSGPAPSAVWLFEHLTGDFGHLSAVSAVTGKFVLWSSLTWNGGSPESPAGARPGYREAAGAWETTEIGSGCYQAPVVIRRDWELRLKPFADPPFTPKQAADHVLSSAFVHGLSTNLSVLNTVTLHFGVLSATSPPSSEYIVIVNAAKSK